MPLEALAVGRERRTGLMAVLRDLMRRILAIQPGAQGVSGSVFEYVEQRVQLGNDTVNARLDEFNERFEERIQLCGNEARAYAEEKTTVLRGEIKGFMANNQGFSPGFVSTAGIETALAFQVAGLRRALDEPPSSPTRAA